MFFQYRLMDMEFIFRLFKGYTLRALQDFFSNLFTAVGWQTVKDDTVRLCMA